MNLEFKILDLLRRSEEVYSGELIAKELGVSRVAIWKAIKRLQEKGYPIKVSRRGYSLENRDIILPEDLEKIISKSSIFKIAKYFHEISSTMDAAREIAEAGESGIVVAERQSSGRGRLGRNWESESGGLWLTLALRAQIPLKKAFLLTYLSSVATVEALKRTYYVNAKVKWPNDVLLDGKKVGGILLEIKAEVDLLSHALIGIGININNRVADKRFEMPAISVSEFLGRKLMRLPLLKNLLERFEELFLEEELILDKWKSLSETLGRRVRIITHEEIIEGIATDLNEEGALLVHTVDGKLKRIFSGDCFHLR